MAQTEAQKRAQQRYREKLLKDQGNVRVTLFVPERERERFIELARIARDRNQKGYEPL